MWNPSTCECQCDTWCKPGQYLDHVLALLMGL